MKKNKLPVCSICMEQDDTARFRSGWNGRICDLCVQEIEDKAEFEDLEFQEMLDYEEALYEEEDND